MCGIAGTTKGFRGNEIEKMLDQIRHRGPDDSGIFVDESLSMGMVRLSVLDTSKLGHQPMQSHCGRYSIVYNGECYNYKELRETLQLKGEKFISNSDTEVVLASYIHYGVGCLAQLNGMFAFAIWDTLEKKLFAARDRLGIKPFYYTMKDGNLTFGSEIKAMLASSDVDFKLDEEAIFQYFTFGHIQQPHTIIKEVSALMPGHFLIWHERAIVIDQYWEIGNKTLQNISYEDAVENLRIHIKRSIAMQMVSDRPLGLFLSGGLDSSAIMALMHLNELDIHSFTIGFPENPVAKNEMNEAESLAKYFGGSHQSISLSGEDVTRQLPDYFKALDQPSTDGLNTYLISKYASGQITVALSGLGPDEIFGGYSRHALIPWKHEHNSELKNLLSKGIPARIDFFPKAVEDFFLKSKSYLSKNDILFQFTQSHTLDIPANICDILHAGVLNKLNLTKAYRTAFSGLDSTDDTDVLRKVLRMDVGAFMSSQLLRDMDAVSMASSLEVRFPFIDHELVEFAFSLPSKYKVRTSKVRPRGEGFESYITSGTKRLLLDSVGSLLPKDFGLRPKNGFKLPINLWLRLQKPAALREMIYDRQDDWKDYIKQSYVEETFRQFYNEPDSTPVLWNLLTFTSVVSSLKQVKRM